MLKQQIAQSVQAIRAKTDFQPELGIILGTGLGKLAGDVAVDTAIPYSEIPHFPPPTVESHRGRLLLGMLGGRPVAVMQGRFHYYEGYEPDQIAHPVRVMKELGVGTLIVSNASGGVNPQFHAGEVAVITDHINLTGLNPLRGANDDTLGPRFPHMAGCYDPLLVSLAMDAALKLGIRLYPAVYAWVTGPNLETAAEYRYIRTIGADLVGMSTVPEVIVARHAGLRVLGFSVITDMGLPDAMQPVGLQEVLAMAAKAEPSLTAVVGEVVKLI
ncbi:purine-nucleoside phosphorylase [candidate division WOR-3 bacterium]|uniref:Purine nucleoside phosphorylase n=1 Tax=candidate division WOR-3 bacterium TaxID=2052148 RepID=A0A937XFD3_UNCW3|nr:purine-nucleoside phosphorylase [candidate division WOR-3 bacterium]